MTVVHNDTHAHTHTHICEQFLNLRVGSGFRFRFCVFVSVEHYMCCYVSLDQFIPVLLTFVVLGLVSSEPTKPRDWLWEEMTYSVSSGT